ncbi:MAG: porin [Candidatus Krumholzibacteria bacterium]|nr:porin [Candidatus Krumholzibacteria bacterium]
MRPIPAAIVFLLLPPISIAAADRADWSLYGKAILSADWADDGDGGSFYLASHNSRIGFRGNYDLGNDLEAIWQIETRIGFDDSGDPFGTRNTFAGIRGPFGTVRLGRHDTPFKEVVTEIDPFLQIIGDSRNIAWLGSRFNIRADNIIRYDSPPVKGIRLSALYKTPEGEQGSDLLSGGIECLWRGVRLTAAAEIHGKTLSAGADTLSDGDREYGLRVAGIWSGGTLEVFGLFESLADIGGVCGADRLAWSAGAVLDATDAIAVSAKYTGTGGVRTLEDTGAGMIAGMADFKFTQKALVFLAGAVTLNGEAASFGSTGLGDWSKVIPLVGSDPWTMSLGLIVVF